MTLKVNKEFTEDDQRISLKYSKIFELLFIKNGKPKKWFKL